MPILSRISSVPISLPSTMASSQLEDDFAPAAQHDHKLRLRQHFGCAVAEILDSREQQHLKPSTAFAQQLAEVAYNWCETALGPDLERFARHGKRTKVGAEDVVFACRKNDVLHDLMEREAQKLRSVRQKTAQKGDR